MAVFALALAAWLVFDLGQYLTIANLKAQQAAIDHFYRAHPLLGMLLGTLVYVNAGSQLARIDALSDIASPGLLGSFVALGGYLDTLADFGFYVAVPLGFALPLLPTPPPPWC